MTAGITEEEMVACIVIDDTVAKAFAYDHIYTHLREICLVCQECSPVKMCRHGHC
mgnify:CR=1 FL=1